MSIFYISNARRSHRARGGGARAALAVRVVWRTARPDDLVQVHPGARDFAMSIVNPSNRDHRDRARVRANARTSD